MDSNSEIMDYIKERAGSVDRDINSYLTDKTSVRNLEYILGRSGYKYDSSALEKSIVEPAKYILGLGGKRWRPVLMLAVIDALGGNSSNFTEFSIIPEIIHNATLIHDDLEDNSDMRRGSPAVHVKYGADVAINLGDFMFYFPIVAMMDSPKLTKETKARLIDVYEREMLRVTLGQATDIAWHRALVDPLKVTESEYMQMAYSKTGVLANMSAKLGGILGGADEETVNRLGAFGASIGVAFQLQDDLLNITDSAVAASKGGSGEDITEGKITLMVVHALANADENDKRRLTEILKMHTTERKLIEEAISIIFKYKSEEYVKELEAKIVRDAWKGIDSTLKESDAKRKLKELAEFLINRSL